MSFEYGEQRDANGNITRPGSWGVKSTPKEAIERIVENFRSLKDDGAMTAAWNNVLNKPTTLAGYVGEKIITTMPNYITNSNLDDIVITGFYYCGDSNTNKPSSSAGHLTVIASSRFVTQMYHSISQNITYTRKQQDDTWSSWETYAPANHAHMTADITNHSSIVMNRGVFVTGDWNNYTTAGIYGVNSSSNTANSPFGKYSGIYKFGTLIVCPMAGSGFTQIYISHDGEQAVRQLWSNSSWRTWALMSGDGHTHTSFEVRDATSANEKDKVVRRNDQGNFSAGTITAKLDGNASTATKINNGASRKAASDKPSTWPKGMYYTKVYNDGFPVGYGKLLTMRDAGSVQLVMGWPGSGTPNAIQPAYIRSAPDTGTDAWTEWQMVFTSGTHIIPRADNTYTVGNSANRIKQIFAATATISTSDRNAKTDIADTSLGLDFINTLRPVEYRYKVKENQVTSVEDGVETVELEPERTETRVVTPAQYETVVITPESTDEDGTVIPVVTEERLVQAEVTEQVIIPAITEERPKYKDVVTPIPGVRTHVGLIAQDVEAALDGKDVALYTKDETTGQYGLRYEEFIGPLIKAVQELSARVEQQAQEIAELRRVSK